MNRPGLHTFVAGDRALTHWHDEESQAALAFERRWTLRALRRVAPELAVLLEEQRALFSDAKASGDFREIELQGSAMCRGWQAAVTAMEAAGEPDDAYLFGYCTKSGCKVAIGDRHSSAERVADLYGGNVVWLSPDEVATLYASQQGFKAIDAIKRRFPGAEVVDVREGDAAE